MILMAVSAKGFPIEGEMNLLECYEAAVHIMGSIKKNHLNKFKEYSKDIQKLLERN